MTWLFWRQQRLEAAMAFGLLALATALLVPLGLHMASVYAGSGAAACVAHTAANGLLTEYGWTRLSASHRRRRLASA